jgi:hypothetical protein
MPAAHSNLAQSMRWAEEAASRTYDVVMTLDEWAELPRCPYERDEHLHAKRITKCLEDVHVDQLQVMAYRVGDGPVHKLDGHSRTLVWLTWPEEARPRALKVKVYVLERESDVHPLYDHIDNRAATESAADKIRGAFINLRGSVPESPFFRNGSFATSLSLLVDNTSCLRADPYIIIQEWAPEIDLLDIPTLLPSLFPSPIAAAALLTTAVHGKKVIAIWEEYNRKVEPGLSQPQRSGLQYLAGMVHDRNVARRWSGNGNIIEATASAILFIEAHLRMFVGAKQPPLPSKFSHGDYLMAYRQYALYCKRQRALKRPPVPFKDKLRRWKTKETVEVKE